MEHYVTLERAIACPRASVAVAAETAAQVLTAAGYRRGLGFGPTSSYVRAYRPAWVTIVAIVGAIPTLGLALLLLRVRSKDHCNVVIEDGPYGVVALVSGRVPAGLPAALEEASGQYVEQQQYQGGYPQQSPPPVLLAPSPGQDGAPSHTPQAILRPAQYPHQGQPQQQPQPQQYQPAQHQPAPHQPQQHQPAQQPYPQPSFDPYPVPQYGGAPGRAPEPEPAAPAAPAPVRPPSRLAPPMPGDSPGREQAVAHAGANGSPAAAPPAPSSDDDPFSSTSGRVPWVGGGRPGPLPAPPGPAPASPISRPPGFPPAAPPQPAPQPAQAVAAASSVSGQGHAPAPVRAATAVSDASPVLRVDTGDVLELGPFCLLGREPVARDGDPQAQLVRFDDPKLSVSKTHMAYGVDGQGIWVMDRNSTNGTTVIDPTGRRIPCTPGNRQYIGLGYQVQIGQRRITVESPGPAA